MNNFIAFLLLIIPCALHGIQVYENVTNDITTATTKLVIVPTPMVQNNVTEKDNVTESTIDVKGPVNINDSFVPMTQEKNYRKPEDDRNRPNTKSVKSSNIPFLKPISFSSNKFDQQQKTSSNVKHEKFVPSPEISLSGIPEPTISENNRDNFYPTNQYYRPVKHSVHFHSSAPITSINSNWKNSDDLHLLPKNFPKFEDEVEKENEKIMWAPPSYENGKWFFMPDKHRTEVTEKPKPSNGKWKWVLDEDEQDKPSVPFNYNSIKSSDFAAPSIPPNEFSYTFEIPTTDSTPFSFGSTKYDGFDQPSSIEPSTTITTSDSEWESPFVLANGNLKHKNRGKGKQANISPWKKILHVLTAAIPIGLLISALTPQVIYVDPNSTSSISPSNSLSLLSTTKHRSLDKEPIQLPDTSEMFENKFGRKLMSNPLIDFLNVLRDNSNGMERTDACDDRNFCEISRSGADPDATVLNKMLWKIANETPELQARKSGLEHIFHAIRDDNCSIFECKKQETNYHRQNYRKN